MANLSKTKTIFAFTSPRTVEKIIPEIEILINSFDGQTWNTQTQISFFNQLYHSPFYEGDKMPDNPALAARDRITRAPKALGFVDLKPTIALTRVGSNLLSGKRTHEVITRQLFKFQLPSPFHKIPTERNFNVRPYLEFLRIVKELGTISKTEVAIFFIQIINYKRFELIAEKLKSFRIEASKERRNRKAFIERVFKDEIFKIYSEEIELNNLKTRESSDKSLEKFIKTKKSNLIDYADALIRYLRATQLITFDKKTFRVIISPSRIEEVDYILKNVPRQVGKYKSEAEYKEYLYNPTSLLLLTDDRRYLESKLSKLKIQFIPSQSIEELKDLLENSEKEKLSSVISNTKVELKNYKEFDNIIDVFKQVISKDVPDPPLYLEWNVWRSLIMINYAVDVRNNFQIDLDGVPLSTASGNMPDIEVQYEGFKMIVEVTMSSGNKQYEMEGEPVARHFGKIQASSNVPVYCLFIAPKISEGALAHFFNLNKMKTRAYGGKTRIVPMNLNQFILFISMAKDRKFNNPRMLKQYFDKAIEKNIIAEDEEVWYKHIHDSISSWVN